MDWITTSTILEDLADYANHDAWVRFAERFRVPVERFSRRIGLSPADAEEAAQETLMAFAESVRSGRYDRKKGRLKDWLFGIALRQALAKRREVGQQPAPILSDPSSFWQKVPDDDSAVDFWQEEWETAVLSACLVRVRQEVEPATMHAFELVFRCGLSPADAAREMGVPPKVVYNAKYTVLKKLRQLAAEFEEDSTDNGMANGE